MQKLKTTRAYTLILAFICVIAAVSMMRLLGPKVGNTLSTISTCFDGPCPPTSTTGESADPSIEAQLYQIDKELSKSLEASIAYNAPTAMNLEDTVTIELLLNPSESLNDLGEQITEAGVLVTATIEITPRMKAELLTKDQDAFNIQPIHASAEQIISGTETTKWSWYVTAEKAGVQELTIVIYRLVKYENQEYWREVEAYKANIDVKVSLVQRITSLDWKWLVGILITTLLIPAFWRWYDRKRKQSDEAATPNHRKKKVN
jgi:hypothetical protein